MSNKITRHTGASVDDTLTGPVQAALSRRPTLGGAPSVGKNLELSGTKESKKSNEERPSLPQPVHTTESPSPQTGEETSIVDTTDGNTPETPNPLLDNEDEADDKSKPAKKSTKSTKKAAHRVATVDEFE